MAKISIVIPVYKVPFKYLDQCIESVVNQTEKDLEIIIVDDGSPKEWAEKCDDYAKNDNRIKVIHKKNGGVSSARNKGLQEATSDWITFIDGDDWIEPNFIEIFLDENKKEYSDIYYFSGFKDDKICEPFFEEGFIVDSKLNKEDLQTLCFTNYTWKNSNTKGLMISSIWAKIYNKQFLLVNNLKFQPTPYAEDCLFFLDTTEKANKIKYIPKPFYHYRTNELSAVNSFRPNAIHEHNWYLNYITDFIIKNNKSKDFIKKFNYRILTSIFNLLKHNFYNKKNKVSFYKKWKSTNDFLKLNLYSNAIKEVNPNLLSRNAKIKYYLLKYKLFPIIELGRKHNSKIKI